MYNNFILLTIATERYIFNSLESICIHVQNKLSNKIKVVNINFDQSPEYPNKKRETTGIVQSIDINFNIYDAVHIVLKNLFNFLIYIEKKYKPSALLFADDTGGFEKFIISYCNLKKIPVILWAHGRPAPRRFTPEYPWLKEYREHFASPLKSLQLSPVFPFGFNGRYYLCTNSAYDTMNFVYFGLPASRIRQTGNPSLDELVASWGATKPTLRQDSKIKKILFISSGFIKFNFVQDAKMFYNFLLECSHFLQKDKYEIYLRLKPGEDINLVHENLHEHLCACNITIVDNSMPLSEVANEYDVALSDHSTGLVEAMLCHVPCIRIVVEKYYPVLAVFSILELENPHDADAVMQCALDEKYIVFQNNMLKNIEMMVFHRLDGLAASRIADVVIEAIKNKDLVDPFQPFVYPQQFEPQKIWHPNVWIPSRS